MRQGFIKKIIMDNKILCIFGFLFSIFLSIFIAFMPVASKYLIDDVLSADNTQQIYFGILIFFIVCLLQPFFFFIKEKVFIFLCEKIAYSLRIKAFQKFEKLPLAYFESNSFGELSVKILNDTKEISQYIYVFFSSFVTSLILLCALFVTMFIVSWKISLIITIILLLYSVYVWNTSKKMEGYSKKSLELSGKMQDTIKKSFDNAVLTKVFSAEQYNLQKYVAFSKEAMNIQLSVKGTTTSLNSITMTITSIALCVVYGVGAIFVLDGQMTLGGLIAMGLFYQALISPLSSLIGSNLSYNKIKPSLKRIEDFFSEEEELGKNSIDNEKPSIVFSNVSFKYPKDDNYAIANLNFSIQKNGCYVVSGNSGKGKSTIAKLILGLYKVDIGDIKLFGENILNIDKSNLRSKISYVSQDVELINDTIVNNMRIANPNAKVEDIKNLCKYLGLDEKIMSMKDDYYSLINEKINLSGGEKRRLSIVRGLLKKAAIYIFFLV